MTCPLCDAALDRATLLAADGARPDLRGFRCAAGHGVFLPSDLYAEWRDREDAGAPPPAPPRTPAADAVGDVRRPKLCPQDGRIMSRYRAGHTDAGDGGFWIDNCGACGGAWFDGTEWEATVAAGLHVHLADVFTDAWQRAAEDAAADGQRRARLAEAAGEDALDRVDAFRAWVWSHPQRHLLLARLAERPAAPDADR